MKVRVLWRISVTVSPQAEEAVTELLGRTFGDQPASYTDLERRTTVVTVFFKKRPEWSRHKRLALNDALRQLKLFGLNVAPARISLAKLRPENWAETWKRHFRPITIQSRLLIKPSWSRRRPSKNQATVILNPGLSFGTGQHPTTRFCLEQIVAWRKPGLAQSFLDLGAGSGILGIAAAKLGYSPIVAIDLDPEAIRFARANIRLNRSAGQIRISEGDISRLPRRATQRYSMICANLISNLLLSESERILARLESNGLLVFAGILKSEFADVGQHYAMRGLRLVASRTEREWRSGAFCWSPNNPPK